MDFMGPRADSHLLYGCLTEFERARLVAGALDGLRVSLPDMYQGPGQLMTLIDEINTTGRLLRNIVEEARTHQGRVPMMLEYLNIVLPCLSKSLRDIMGFNEDTSHTKEIRWRKMYHKMTDEACMPLPVRFHLYNHYLRTVLDLLTRHVNFDPNTLELLKSRILDLRERRGIPPPTIALGGPLVRQDMMAVMNMGTPYEHGVHWAEQIFSMPLPSRTTLHHRPSDRSASLGPHQPFTQMAMPVESKILFKRPLDHERLTIVAYLDGLNRIPSIRLQTFHLGEQWYSAKGTNELCIKRNGSAIELRRWSQRENRAKLWGRLFFVTWEEMVLFFCTFVSLKARNELTLSISPEEYKLKGEKLKFQAQINDDSFKHTLLVFQDKETNGMRLHAAVYDGELRQSPVWTAFITHQSASPTWLVRKGRRRIWLKDIQLYVFCSDYRQQSQRCGRGGEFELEFLNEKAATCFKELFDPPKRPASAASTGKSRPATPAASGGA